MIQKLDDLTLNVYQGKIDKNVLLRSFVYTNLNIANNEKILPDNAVFHTSTKFGADFFLSNDQKMFSKLSFKSVAAQSFFHYPRYIDYQYMDFVQGILQK